MFHVEQHRITIYAFKNSRVRLMFHVEHLQNVYLKVLKLLNCLKPLFFERFYVNIKNKDSSAGDVPRETCDCYFDN
ncbi:MAG: hypothetical protein UR66_C0001G0015 [Candidatus Moranbacteria bacterium GW2011_GWE1_35_17]|nr:MAG: hypothetical protein UR66_C0001G0015 [Candidatus Moranbacteria bacterium GW2011_GWE1_35_17]KKP71854.1 MAG: hypothetical protein UR65_C0025G0016 [Candidatus Moranbacteria bacterium GW2011_GWE2_35_164]KKP83118.1 MAG: hypothetical protein UR83_C0039G0012 [Candidatus Moranbacteria bacterium GW2011_GWF2_35_54]KKP83550.1 MAG: hypothetical protein UR82_C0020G0014 [Candidatus Moranbacteria bacterium GW2011_GWF1_35_5]